MQRASAERIEELTRELLALQIRRTQIIAELATEDRAEQAAPHVPPLFAVGDRVRITNRVNRPSGWVGLWDAERNRNATVTSIVDSNGSCRVHLRTHSGVKTWRAPQNLRLKDHDE